MVLVDSQWFYIVLVGSQWFSVVLVCSRRFSVVLVDCQWFSVDLPVGSRRFSMVTRTYGKNHRESTRTT